MSLFKKGRVGTHCAEPGRGALCGIGHGRSEPAAGLPPRFRQLVAFGDELQRDAVVAKALSGRLRAIVEDVPLMPATAGAVIFGAGPRSA